MKRTTTLQLFTVLLILVVLIWLLERRSPVQFPKPERLIPFNIDEIVTLGFEKDSIKIKCSRIGMQWRIVSPVNARADAGVIMSDLHTLEMLKVDEVITESQLKRRGLTLKDYGLVPPRARITLGTRKEFIDILVGDSSPVGDSVYVNIKGLADVIATSRVLLDVIPASPEVIRERLLLDSGPERISGIEIHRAGLPVLSIERHNDRWQLKQPFVAPANHERVSQLLKFLYELRIEKFIWDPPVSIKEKERDDVQMKQSLLSKFQLTKEQAPLRILLQETGKSTPREIITGKNVENAPETVYIRLSDEPSIYSVGSYFVSALSSLCDNVAEKRLFPVKADEIIRVSFRMGDNKFVLLKDKTWNIVEPVKYNADIDAVNKLLEDIVSLQAVSVSSCAKTNLPFQGLNQQCMLVEMNWLDFSGKDIPATNAIKFVFSPWNKEKKQSWAVLIPETSSVVFDVSQVLSGTGDTLLLYQLQTNFVKLAEQVVEYPANYFSKTILNVPAKSIQQLTLQKGGRELSIARNAENIWTAVKPVDGQIENNVVEDILKTVASLKAIRVEIYNPSNLSVYGLDPPQAKLTIDAGENEVARKSILLGFRAGIDGIYAKLQGDDVVFVVETRIANTLARDFLVTGASISSFQP
jgi:hypothetical protein